MRAFIAIAALVAVCSAEIYFEESFGEGWEDRWVQSEKSSDLGKFVSSAGKYYNDEAADAGIQTSQDAKFYGLSAKFDKFSNEGKTLVIQYRVKHEQNIDCGGGYVKVFPSTVEGKEMHGESPYNIMFGPDICGPGTRKVHVIFSYKGENYLIENAPTCKTDEDSHLYTLIVKPDNSFEVKIDGDSVKTGTLEDDFKILKPKEINDPEVSKPKDWVDETMIDDPEDKKPDDWVEETHIIDPEAEKPEDWDDEMDGEWEAPQIDNPDYKGEWKAKRIDNPDYKGPWVHPQIPNPEYEPNDKLYAYDDFGAIGFDLWQVKSGTIFDDVLITDDVELADERVKAFKELAKGELAMKTAEQEKKAAEEAAKAKEEEEAEEDEEEAEDEEEEGTEKKDEL